MPIISVVMPTFKQAPFIERALDSLLAQSLSDWELVIVDDGSPDETRERVAAYLDDPRIRYHRLTRNAGLAAALNAGMERTEAPLIAYLPSDDVYYADHLAGLTAALDAHPDAALAYTGVRHHYNRMAPGQIDGYPLQLVQVAHRRTPDRWLERSELTTDDLDRMFWTQLRERGAAAPTGNVSCEWVNHPHQRHKIIQEPEGGINLYRTYYGVSDPLRFHSSIGNRIDEVAHYRRFRERPDTPRADDGLIILLVGELAYNPERILALEERGHRLYGLWMQDPYWFNTVGPLPFGHVRDLPRHNWQDAIRELQPDIIYALLNWQAVPFAHEVLSANPGIPFVWHFKEGPFICLEKGLWPQLMDLHTRSHGQIYCSPEMRAWYTTLIPALDHDRTLILDGDLPKAEWFADTRVPRLSDRDGEPHTVVAGRPIGLHPWVVEDLAGHGIHLHFYGDYTHGQWADWIERVRPLAPRHLHLHSTVDQEDWVTEFSRYDAGWLHFFKSENRGEIRRSVWDDLNYPARIGAMVAAGIPLLQYDNAGAAVATQTLVRDLDIGLFFRDAASLRAQLDDTTLMARLRGNIWRRRGEFTFDAHADRLIAFFRRVIAAHHQTH